MKSGKESTEHARAWRAEVVGVLLVTLGICGVPAFGWQAVAVVAIGALATAWTATAYMHARSAPKAQAERPRVL